MTFTAAVAMLAAPLVLAVAFGFILLKRALAFPKLLAEELAFAVAWVFVVGSLIWLGAFLTKSIILGFGAPWTWLAAVHFAFAGAGALTVTAISCRVVSNPRCLRVLRILLFAHPVAYLTTAAGIFGIRLGDEIGATAYAVIFATQLGAVLCEQTHRIANRPRIVLVIALTVPLGTMVPALAWAWGHPIFDMSEMVRYHGLMNAVGHVGLGLAAFAWARPGPHGMDPSGKSLSS